ncbi:hypothetical protein B0J14DRAFT_189181 [Halenospora varia]|nr:hypothetical protein B0J14DRAFT_189181 [Halenospora varia]
MVPFPPLHHTPALFIAFAMTCGGLLPFFNPQFSISGLGFPSPIYTSKPAQSIMALCSGRTTAIGLAIGTLYYQGNFVAIDTILMCLCWVGLVDGLVLWREG